MEIKQIIVDCPGCGCELKNTIGCIGTPTNVFHAQELSGIEFYCDDCDQSVYLEVETYSD